MIRLVLALLLFRGNDVHKPVGVLSGGERELASGRNELMRELGKM